MIQFGSLRKLASHLRAHLSLIPCYPVLARMFSLACQVNIDQAMRNLIGLSNGIHSDPQHLNYDMVTKICRFSEFLDPTEATQGNDPFIAPDWEDQGNRHSAGDDCRLISGTRATTPMSGSRERRMVVAIRHRILRRDGSIYVARARRFENSPGVNWRPAGFVGNGRLAKIRRSRRNAAPVLHSRISTGGRNGHYALRSVVRICSHSGGRFPNPFGLHHQ
jgi:hypothetical protein